MLLIAFKIDTSRLQYLKLVLNLKPFPLTGRNMHTSGLIQDHETHMQHIVVIGGVSNFQGLNSVEIMFNGENNWLTGKNSSNNT